jgi:uncharacterized membrane protein
VSGERGPERLFTFLDAVVAIAITLLVLPLVEVLGSAEAHRAGLAEVLRDNAANFGAFALSFVVIARLWWSHHRLGERVRAVDGASVLLNLGWVLTVVVLPFATQVVAGFPPDPLPVAIYIGTITLSSACITVLGLLVVRRDALRRPGTEDDARAGLISGVVTTALFALALVLGTAIRSVNYLGLLLLFVSGPLERLVDRAAGARSAGGG